MLSLMFSRLAASIVSVSCRSILVPVFSRSSHFRMYSIPSNNKILLYFINLAGKQFSTAWIIQTESVLGRPYLVLECLG